MKTNHRLTATEANAIHAEWMALESNAPEKEKQRVFALMRKLPQSFVSIGIDRAQVIISGTPAHGCPESIPAALERAKRLGVQTALRWNAAGHWEGDATK